MERSITIHSTLHDLNFYVKEPDVISIHLYLYYNITRHQVFCIRTSTSRSTYSVLAEVIKSEERGKEIKLLGESISICSDPIM